MKQVYVYYKSQLLGNLFIDVSKGDEYYFFQYSEEAIKNNLFKIVLDHNIYPINEKQFLNNPKELFGFIKDCLPDRWGRNLIIRNELINAKEEKRKKKTFLESDFLLGLSDNLRMGALQFKLEKDGPYLNNSNDQVPPMVYLNKLEHAAYNIEDFDDKIKILLSPGSSLGGARPKANVIDNDGNLWIAKFPHKHDDYDIQAFEKVCNDLAKMCGIDVPESKLLSLSKNGSTFLVKRFDRDKSERIHFTSFMTILDCKDGDSNKFSYLDMANALKEISDNPKGDLKQLFLRVAFNIAMINSDDHLRNHGMLYKDEKWCLSPAYDLNPNLDKNNLTLKINESSNEYSFQTLLSTAKYYDLTNSEAFDIISNVIATIKDNYYKLTNRYKLNKKYVDVIYNSLNLDYKI